MDLPSNPPVSPAVRITVLLRLVSGGFQDAFAARPTWLEVPAVDLAELRESVGVGSSNPVPGCFVGYAAEAAARRAGL